MLHLPVIAVDFDGLIASWHSGTFSKIGLPIDGAREFLAELSTFSLPVIHTCRVNSKLYDGEPAEDLCLKVWRWLCTYGLDKYVHEVYAGQGKPFAACYIDDKGVHCDPENDPNAFATALSIARAMCCNGKQHCSKGTAK